MMRQRGSWGIHLLSMCLLVSLVTPASAHASAVEPFREEGVSSSPSGAACRDYTFAVRSAPSATRLSHVYGQFCAPRVMSADTPLQILLHGGGYNHTYWDWPYRPQKYSYVAHATRAGYATLNVDRLGYGRSDRPTALSLNFAVAAYVTHQIVRAARAGALGKRFNTIVLNGHSMGGLTAQREASTYRDVDGVIVSGVAHNFPVAGATHLADKVYPAELDPKFGLAVGGLIPGYLTSLPGKRIPGFVDPAPYEAPMAAVEERNKDTVSLTELTGITLDSRNPAITENIDVPVLHALGEHDWLWCTSTGDCDTDPHATDEHSYYSPRAEFEQYVVPGSAHSINTTKAAPTFYQQTFAWLQRHGLDSRPAH